MDIKRQNFLILGVSKSGYSAGKYILSNGGKCYLYEEQKSDRITEALDELKGLGGVVLSAPLTDEKLKEMDVIVISPGVPINHDVAVRGKTLGKRILGELEFAFNCHLPTIVAVTGTNGKTTTVSLIDAILKEEKRKSLLVGNIGVPVSSKIEEIDRNTVCVTEVSSFQLEGVSSFCPHIACVLNIAPDHLERHFDMQTYIYLKKRILKNQKESEYSILNYDDIEVRKMFSETKAKTVWVSLKERVVGAYLLDGKIYYNDDFIMEAKDVNLDGEHNIYNALFAVATCYILGVKKETISLALKEFKGVPHRVELVNEIKGVKFFDDSKATNTASTITAIKTMKSPTILILGGSEKGESYDNLFENIKESLVSHVVLTGASRFNMFSSAKNVNYENVSLTSNFTNAIKIAYMLSKEGDNVLLSPGCASFDSFKNYEERGEVFKKIVGELNVEKPN